jgi:hypothetical protein
MKYFLRGERNDRQWGDGRGEGKVGRKGRKENVEGKGRVRPDRIYQNREFKPYGSKLLIYSKTSFGL